MEFKKESLKLIIFASLLGIFLFGLMVWEFSPKTDLSTVENAENVSPIREGAVLKTAFESNTQLQSVLPDTTKKDDAAIEEQLDRDREQQKQTKYLKSKLEQTNLELEQEKAVAEINKLKKENAGAFDEPVSDGEKNLPEIKVDYIGGDSIKREAILSIAGASYQVKEKSSPTDNIQVVSISDSSVTLHFSAPQELTKTIDFKPE